MNQVERISRDMKESAGAPFLLERKRLLLGQYLSLTEELQTCLEAEREERIGPILSLRQKCAEDVDKTDRLLRKAFQEAGEVGFLEHDQGPIEEILRNIALLDRELLQRLRSLTESAKEDLFRMRTVRGATEKYRGPLQQEPRFLNVSR